MRFTDHVFDDEVRSKYLGHPYFCPWCGCENISAGQLTSEFNYAWQNIICLECRGEWSDVFELVDVEANIEPENKPGQG